MWAMRLAVSKKESAQGTNTPVKVSDRFGGSATAESVIPSGSYILVKRPHQRRTPENASAVGSFCLCCPFGPGLGDPLVADYI